MTAFAHWYCTDCDEPRGVLRDDGRCPMCGGARIVNRGDRQPFDMLATPKYDQATMED